MIEKHLLKFHDKFELTAAFDEQRCSALQQTTTLKMVDQEKSDFYVAFTLSLCSFELKQTSIQVILAGTLTGVQGDIRCKFLAALSTVK